MIKYRLPCATQNPSSHSTMGPRSNFSTARGQGVRRQVPEGIQPEERPQRHEGLQRRLHRQGDHREDRLGRPRAFAAAMKGAKISAEEHPGVLLDVSFNDKGDLDREVAAPVLPDFRYTLLIETIAICNRLY